MSLVHVDNANFEKEVLQSDKPVVVDFYADWCGPCRMITPIMESLAKKLENVKFCKLNVDDAPAIAEKYDVAGIPTVILFKSGNNVNQFSGALPEAAIEDFINKNK